MESENARTPGEDERLLADICRRFSARLGFNDGPDGVRAVLSGNRADASTYSFSTLPKKSADEACATIVNMLLFPDTAEVIGLPAAASRDELRLKMEVAGLS